MKNTCTLLMLAVMSLLSACFGPGVNDNNDGKAPPLGDLTNDKNFELITKVAVSFWQNGDKDLAHETIAYGNQVLSMIESGEISTPKLADEALDKLIAESGFDPAAKQSLSLLVDRLAAEYLQRIDIGQLDPSTTAPVATIVRWVIEASEDTLRFGTPQNYGLQPITADSGAKGLRPEPVDLSLWSYLTNSETKKFCKAYYGGTSPNSEASGQKKLNALRLATDQEGKGPRGLDGRSYAVYRQE